MLPLCNKSRRPIAVQGSDPLYWNRELETKPWRKSSAGRPSACAISSRACRRARGCIDATLRGVVCQRVTSLDDLAADPFTLKAEPREAQGRTRARIPGRQPGRSPPRTSFKCSAPRAPPAVRVYYALTRRDLEICTDAIANTFFTAGLRAEDVVAHLVALPMVAGGLPTPTRFAASAPPVLAGRLPDRAHPQRDAATARDCAACDDLVRQHIWPSGACSWRPAPPALKKFSSGGEPGLRNRHPREDPLGPGHRAYSRVHGAGRRGAMHVGGMRHTARACTSMRSAA